jgi:beige protein homolog 1
MYNTRARRSTSAASYTETEAAPVKAALSDLRILLTKADDQLSLELVQSCVGLVQALQQQICSNEKPNRIQDAFRNFNGFRIILDFMRSIPKLLEPGTDHSRILDYMLDTLRLLTHVLQGHWGNRRYFSRRIDSGGWNCVYQAIEVFLNRWDSDEDHTSDAYAKLFGELVACSIENEAFRELFIKLESTARSAGEGRLTHPEKVLDSISDTQLLIHNPEIFPILLGLWSDIQPSRFLTFLPNILQIICVRSTHNLLAVHETGLLTIALRLLKSAALPQPLLKDIKCLADDLLTLGISQMEDAQLLYGSAITSPYIANTLAQGLRESDGIPYIHFDLSLHGFSSVELPDLGRPFPPPANSAPGYTLSLWLQVVEFDPISHTTIFGAFDATQTCFVLVYLEKDTKNLILQTSVTSSRPSVRFKSFEFEAKKWYHICIVHRRPGITSSSRASLFVDGEFVEQVKAHFPSAPPNGTTDAAEGSARKPKAVQSFLGTPRDLATKLGPGQSSSQWRLASAHLLGEALNDDLIAVYRELGPRYYGNYQDCLGSFQTYEASASLNLRNETLYMGKEEKSTIIAAIRSKAGNLVPESKIILNITPWIVLDDDEKTVGAQTQIIKGLSRDAGKNLRHWSRGGRTSIVINGAIPSINKALVNLSGVAFLAGDPVVVAPQALDDASWRLGGCLPVGLALIEAANTGEDLQRALDIFFATIKGSWRNSEAMERDNGFSIFASVLSARLAKLTEMNLRMPGSEIDEDPLMLDVLLKILVFVGYDPESPEDSVINNPLAYRVLLVDVDIWRSASPEVQKLYYQQFTVFSIGSKHHLFNARRLAKMRKQKNYFFFSLSSLI